MFSRRALLVSLSVVILSAADISAMETVVRPALRLPGSWPHGVKRYQPYSEFHDVASGVRERVYDFTFTNRSEFEEAWPLFLQVRDPNTPLVLKSPSPWLRYQSTAPHIRVSTPPREMDSVDLFPRDHLPKYVANISRYDFAPVYIPADPKQARYFPYYKARTDLVLIVDGDIVDLNRIKLPPDTPIIDRRFEE